MKSRCISKFPRRLHLKKARSNEEGGRRRCGGYHPGAVGAESPSRSPAYDDSPGIQQLRRLPYLSSGGRPSQSIWTRDRSGAEPARRRLQTVREGVREVAEL